jgi:hypothetical protein
VTPEEVEASYREAIYDAGERVTVRRYFANNASWFDARVYAKVARFSGKDLVGAARQGDANVILLVSDLEAKRFPLPLEVSDKVIVDGKEMSIVDPDGATRRVSGVLVAYDLTVRGRGL